MLGITMLCIYCISFNHRLEWILPKNHDWANFNWKIFNANEEFDSNSDTDNSQVTIETNEFNEDCMLKELNNIRMSIKENRSHSNIFIQIANLESKISELYHPKTDVGYKSNGNTHAKATNPNLEKSEDGGQVGNQSSSKEDTAIINDVEFEETFII